MKQWLKDDRFVTEGVFPKEGQRRSLVHRKDELELPPGLAQAHWEKLCRTYGQDPRVEEFEVPIDVVLPGGAAWYPHDYLVWLVGTYALTGGPLDRLMSKLHPRPQDEDEKEAEGKLEQFLLAARQLATLVRGNDKAVKRGPKPVSITSDEQVISWAADPDVERDWPEGLSKDERNRYSRWALPHTDKNLE